jgi:Domain of unknown function (DUF4440)
MRAIPFSVATAFRFSLAALLVLGSYGAVHAQKSGEGKWADANDPVAKQLIEQERKWAVLGCVPSHVIAEFVAEDFVGTAPEGPLYTKAELTGRHEKPAPEHDCKLLSARVRFFGADVAIIYGKETAVHTGKDGKDIQRTLVWTDTALKRNGKWQLIAVQDMDWVKK